MADISRYMMLEAVAQITRAKERARLKISMAQNSKAAGI
jgi:hypothetical protein